MKSETNAKPVSCLKILSIFASICAIAIYGYYNANILLSGVDVARFLKALNVKLDYFSNMEPWTVQCEDTFSDIESLRDKPYPGIHNYTCYIARHLERMHVKPLGVNSTPVYNDVESFTYPIEPSPCIQPTSEISLFVAVISAPRNIDKRNAIRNTWLKQLATELNAIRYPEDASVVLVGAAFIIGQSPEVDITEEATKFSDIILVDMPDAYFNLSIKVAGLLNWVDKKCGFVDFLLKVDDDVYTNVRNLGSFLRQINSTEANIYGINANTNVARSGKWQITYEEYPWGQYPAYFFGPAVLMTHSTLRPLLAAMQTIPYYPIDDVYLSGMCREKAGINLIFADRLLAMTGDRPFETCWMRDYITFLRGGPDQIVNVHNVSVALYGNDAPCFRNNDSLSFEDPLTVFRFPVRKI